MSERSTQFTRSRQILDELQEYLKSIVLTPHQWRARGLNISEDGILRSGLDIIGRPDLALSSVTGIVPELLNRFPDRLIDKIRINEFYKSMIRYQESDMNLYRKEHEMLLPDNLDYDRMKFLSNEVRGKLKAIRPRNIAILKRMEGITPDAVVRLMRYVKDRNLIPRKNQRDDEVNDGSE